MDLIDPTLLSGTKDMESSESFIAIIIGLLNAWAEDKLENCSDSTTKNDYLGKLRQVANSLKEMKPSHKEDDYGIDEIYANQSALKLEQNLHELFREASKLEGQDKPKDKPKIFVIRIDDIDMAFKHGFQVLETIRKYLASPYVLPIISGDSELYRILVEKEFAEDMKSEVFSRPKNYRVLAGKEFAEDIKAEIFSRPMDLNEEDKKKDRFTVQVKDLSEKYLIKVNPFDRQIELEHLEEIINDNTKFVIGNIDFTYKDVKRFQDEFFNHGINRDEFKNKDLSLEKFESLRLWMQYIEKMSDWFIDVKSYETQDDKCNQEWMPLYQEFQQNLYDFTHSLKSHQRTHAITKANLSAIEKDSKGNYWFNHQKLLSSDFFNKDSELNKKYNFNKIEFEGDFFGEDTTDHRPFITKSTEYKAIINSTNTYKFLSSLFIFDNYYAKSHQTKWLLFSGKFLELLLTSFNQTIEEKETAKDILSKTPIFSGINTKSFFEDKDDEDKDEDVPDESRDVITSDDVKLNNSADFILGECTQIQQFKFIDAHFLHEVLNRYFNNFNIYLKKYKVETKKDTKKETYSHNFKCNETFLNYMQRCCYIFLNAVGACERHNSEKVSFQNIAHNDSDTLENIATNSQTYINNITSFIDDSDSLTGQLNKHWLIKLILSKNLSKINTTLTKNIIKIKKGTSKIEYKYDINKKGANILNLVKKWIFIDCDDFIYQFKNKNNQEWYKKILACDLTELNTILKKVDLEVTEENHNNAKESLVSKDNNTETSKVTNPTVTEENQEVSE